MMVSPSRAQAVVDGVESKVSVLYDVESARLFRYSDVFVDWIALPMLNFSADDSGPITAMVSTRVQRGPCQTSQPFASGSCNTDPEVFLAPSAEYVLLLGYDCR